MAAQHDVDLCRILVQPAEPQAPRRCHAINGIITADKIRAARSPGGSRPCGDGALTGCPC
jgi:hypothetical protein